METKIKKVNSNLYIVIDKALRKPHFINGDDMKLINKLCK